MITQRQIDIAAQNCYLRPESYCISMAIEDFLTIDKKEHNAENWLEYYDKYSNILSQKEHEYMQLEKEIKQVKPKIKINPILNFMEAYQEQLRQDQMEAINF